ncbi:nitroreductase family protein [Pseudorhodoplanes sinuspersici]|uniref:Nitroreductase family protein n=1 Tax=Pseudorhodoplanes sinuspersici TaxID=1235591 RepID=A0A1W6ZN79_9HYPH|nr:nitroreductase family protein [Pseudorhodoplanes sinuspersici]ARP98811.1 nitroreductase family protein [Pseudorhodoplanes sinuspersici]RKE69572.1 nitroreductase [Pseudorhodoplanes sinuspersici]
MAETAQDPIYQPLQFREMSLEDMEQRSRDFLAMMARRRTVRDYSDRPVPREIIANAVRTAALAPSGANQQPWTFVCISDPAIKTQIRIAAEEEEKTFYSGRAGEEWLGALRHLGTDWEKPFLETAPWLIAIFGQRYGMGPDGEKVKHYYVPESVGIASGFLIAALHNAGLATLTHTPSPMGFLNEICGRPDSEKAYILLVTGYPVDDCQVPVITKKALDEMSVWV